MNFNLAEQLHNHRHWFFEVNDKQAKEAQLGTKAAIEEEEEELLRSKMGFNFYNENIRNFYREYVQSMITPIDKPKERRIAAELAKLSERADDQIPFIGIAGIPAAGKSYLCSNLQQLLQEEHGINALVVSMDGYHYYRSELDQMEDP